MPLTLAVGLADTFAPFQEMTGALAFCAALAHGWRLSAWRGLATLAEPLLAVLHLGYTWLVLSYGLLGIVMFMPDITRSAALHAMTLGAIGTLILAVMSRASLGHTGRSLHAAPSTTTAYLLVSLAAGLRIAAPLISENYMILINLSGLCWIAALMIFTEVYWPVLNRPRADGKAERIIQSIGISLCSSHPQR